MKKLWSCLLFTFIVVVSAFQTYAGEWKYIGYYWYYIQDDGTPATGIQEIDGNIYCFSEEGRMYHNQTVGGRYYDNDGKYIPKEAYTVKKQPEGVLKSGTYNLKVWSSKANGFVKSDNPETERVIYFADNQNINLDGDAYYKKGEDFYFRYLMPEFPEIGAEGILITSKTSFVYSREMLSDTITVEYVLD